MTRSPVERPLMTTGTGQATGAESGRRLLVAASLGYGSVFLGLALVPPLLPAISDELGIAPLGAGVALSVLWGLRALLQYPSGLVSDHLSRKTVLVAGVGLALAGSGLLAAARTYPGFLLAMAVVGVGNGLYPPAGIALVSERFAGRHGGSLGVLIGTADLAGAAAGGLAVVVLAAGRWRAGFIPVVGALLVTVALLHLWLSEPYEIPRTVQFDVVATARRLFADAHVRWVIVGFAFWIVAFHGAVSFLPTLLVVEKGISLELAGGGFAFLWGIGALVKPPVGRLGDRFGRLSVATAALGLGTVGLGGVLAAGSPAAIFGSVVVFAAGLLATTPLLWAHVADIVPDASIGGDVGALRTLFEGIGSLGPLAVGLVAGRASYAAAFAGLAACLLVATVVVGTLARRTHGA